MVLPVYVYGTYIEEKASAADFSDEQQRVFEKTDRRYGGDNAQGRRGRAGCSQVGHSMRVLVVNGNLLAEDNPALKDFKRAISILNAGI